jgi:hypothetical protein
VRSVRDGRGAWPWSKSKLSVRPTHAADPRVRRPVGANVSAYETAGGAGGVDGTRGPVVLPASPMFMRDRQAIAHALLKRRIPSIAAFRENIEAGALISYGVDLAALFRDIAGYVQQIAMGAKPSEMRIEQSSRFHMAVNLKVVGSLGVALPDAFIARANEVIE